MVVIDFHTLYNLNLRKLETRLDFQVMIFDGTNLLVFSNASVLKRASKNSCNVFCNLSCSKANWRLIKPALYAHLVHLMVKLLNLRSEIQFWRPTVAKETLFFFNSF